MSRQLFARLSKESFIYGLSAAASKLVGLILVPLYARALTQDQFGYFNLIVTGTGILSSLLILGLDAATAITFYRTEDLQQRRTIASSFLFFEIILTVVVCGLLFVLAKPIAIIALGSDAFTHYVQLGILTVPFAVYITMFLDLARLVRLPWRYMAISIGNLLLTFILILLGITIMQDRIEGVLAASLVGSALFSFVGFYITREQYGLLFSPTVLRRMLMLGLPLVPASIAIWVINFSNSWFLLHIGSSAAEVGILSMANRLAAPIVLVVTAFQIAWVPFSLSIARHEAALSVYGRTLAYFLAANFGILLLLTLVAEPVIIIFAGPGYLPASQVLALAGMSSIANGVYYIIGTGLTLAAKTVHIGWTTVAAAIADIVLNIALIPVFGLVGAASAGLLANVVSVVLLYVVAQRIYRIPYNLPQSLLLTLLASVLLVLATVLHLPNPGADFLLRSALLASLCVGIFGLRVVQPRNVKDLLRMARSIISQRTSM